MEISKDKIAITQYINSLSNQLDLTTSLLNDVNGIREKLSATFLMSDYKNYHLYDSFLIKNSNAFISFYEVSYSIKNGKYNLGDNELQTIGCKKLNTSYGHILIRPEFLIDKIASYFNPIEIDFAAYPTFSDKYYVLIEKDVDKLFFTDKTVNLIENLPKVYIEIIGNVLFIKFMKKFNKVDSDHIIAFLKLIN